MMSKKESVLRDPYKVIRKRADGLHPVGKPGGHNLAFCPTLEKARFVAAALNAYYHFGFDFDTGSSSSQCKYDRGDCSHPERPHVMNCHQQNCPWEERRKDEDWWFGHPGRFNQL